ncbi:MFS transporter [Pyruvatibacter sp. HU-CL02332]|uniref:MFS transporter n=1 Tax=Pyruvatibacter sp. HU-CL02332 TaxID=3127650 RepID=UPI0031065DCE
MTTQTLDHSGLGEGLSSSRKARLGWILYAPGNETINVLLLYFIMAPYLTNVVVGDGVAGQTLWGWISAFGAIIVAIGGQILGSATDVIGGQKRFISGFVLMASAGAAALWFATPNAGTGLVILMSVATLAIMVGAELTSVLHNAMLPRLAPRHLVGRLSGTSIATGIAWGLTVLGAYIVLFMIPEVPFLGLDKASHEHDRISGPIAGVALLLFTVPLLLLTPPTPINRVCLPIKRLTFGVLGETYRSLRSHPRIAGFIIARMIYQDGIAVALAFGSIYAAGHFGWDGLELGIFGMVVLGSSAIGAFIGGKVDDHIGAKRTILISLLILLTGIIGLVSIPAPAEAISGFLATPQEQLFIGLACVLGVSIGPAQGSGRSLMARLAPAGESGRWYGIMALTGNAVAFTGPLMVAIVTDATDSQRVGLMVSPVLIFIGLLVLLKVENDNPKGPQPQ